MLSQKKFNKIKIFETENFLNTVYYYLINKFFNIELIFEKNYYVKIPQLFQNSAISSCQKIKVKKNTESDVIPQRLLYDDNLSNNQIISSELNLSNNHIISSELNLFNTQIISPVLTFYNSSISILQLRDKLLIEKSIKSFITKYNELYISMMYRFTIIKSLKLNDLIILKQDIFFYNDYINIPFKELYFNFHMKSPFSQEIININNQINFLGGKTFKSPLLISEEEDVNGYYLYEIIEGNNIMNYDTFTDYLKLWNKINLNVLDGLKDLPIPSDILSIIAKFSDMSDNEFIERFEKIACSDWSKQDKYGESYGGFWKYSEDSYEFKNAYTLSREDNLKSLLKLPYPREFILETINIGCNNRLESVRYSNFLCEWMKRKIASISDFI